VSVDGLRWALKVSGVSPVQKLVLVVLGDYATENAVSFPKQTTLADRCCVVRASVSRALAELKEAGLIEDAEPPAHVVAKNQKAGRFSLKAYRLNYSRSKPVTGPCNTELHGQDEHPDQPPCNGKLHGADLDQAPPCNSELHGPCNAELPSHVTESYTDRVTQSDRPICVTSESGNFIPEREKTPDSFSEYKGTPTDEEIQETWELINSTLGLPRKDWLPGNKNSLTLIWRRNAGETEGIAACVEEARVRCAAVNQGVTLDYLERKWPELRSLAAQKRTTPKTLGPAACPKHPQYNARDCFACQTSDKSSDQEFGGVPA